VLTEPGALPAVIHCTAGRDRTGVVAALLLAVLGVADAEIARDYALSGAYLRPHLPRFARLAEQAGIDAERLARALDTSEEAMAACLAYLRARYGSAEAYLRAAGVSAERLHRLRTLLLEPSMPAGG
jgi:protein-tyrosine phosphatase